MIAEATYLACDEIVNKTAAAAMAAGEVQQLADGRAGVSSGLAAAAAGDKLAMLTEGKFLVPKTTGIVLLDGGRVYWDFSANKAHYKKVNDRDFYLGRSCGDAASGDTTCTVALNADPPPDIDLYRDGFLSVPTGTQAVGGFGYPKLLGGCHVLELTATSEAQCIDLFSVDRFAVAANAIAEFIVRPNANGSTSAVDFSVGLANGTDTADADAISEHCLIHIDGGSVNINAQSKDGTTTVAATDTTADISAGSAVANRTEIWLDTRDPADVQIYVDGALVLGSSVFDLSHAAGPLGLIAHLEKTTGTATAKFTIDRMSVRFQE